jgi:hypothetical protein
MTLESIVVELDAEIVRLQKVRSLLRGEGIAAGKSGEVKLIDRVNRKQSKEPAASTRKKWSRARKAKMAAAMAASWKRRQAAAKKG